MSLTTLNKTKILVVEDDLFMQAILKEYLSSQYDVEICSNGTAAFALIQHGNIPDLIIADLNTPELSGLGLTEQLKASDFFSSIPIIILSAEESSVKRIECLNSGADDFIVKPFNPSELQARINVILRRMVNLNKL